MTKLSLPNFWQKGFQTCLIYLLFLSLMVQSSPLFFYLKDYQANPRPTLTQSVADKLINKAEAKENTSKKTANTNFYETSDGKGYAVVSSNSVNFKNSAGDWQPIDNKLEKINSSQLNDYAYNNAANRYSVKFKNNSNNNFFKFQQDDYSLEFGLEDSQNVKPEVNESTITYKNILENIDLEYNVNADFVKNNIILQDEPNTDKLRFNLDIGPGLNLSKSTNGDIHIISEDQTIDWIISPPSILDKITNYNIVGDYQISQPKTNHYILEMSLTPFLPKHDMGYPVIIDPSIAVNSSSIADCANPVENYKNNNCLSALQELQIGKTVYGQSTGYLKFNLPAELNNQTIDSAIFAISAKEELASISRVNLYRVTSSWSHDTSLSSLPGSGSLPESSYTNNNAYAWWNFDITKLMKDWTSGAQPNYGILLKNQDPILPFRTFASPCFGDTNDTYRPYLLVNYSTNPGESKLIGSHSWWQYVTTDLTEGGSNINVASGNLNLSFDDVSSKGIGFDSAISHTYNSLDNYDGPYGYNWTISANERLSFPNNNRQTVVYNDESNTQFTFYDDNNDNSYVDSTGRNDDGIHTQSDFYRLSGHRPNGLNWGLKYDPNLHQFIARTNTNNTLIFDENGILLKETDKNGNYLNYNYVDGRLSNITDSSGQQVKLSYENGRLQEVTDHNYNSPLYHSSGGKITYEYQDGNLWKVHYYSGDTMVSTTTYGYTNHLLTSVTDNKNYTTNYNYSNNKVYEIINPKLEKTSINYDAAQGLTKVTAPKGYETGNNPDDFTTYYYYRNNAYFQPGLVYKTLSPTIKNQAGVATRTQTEFDYDGDYSLTATVGPKYLTNSNAPTITATAYDDISGLPTYQYSANHVLTLKNTYSYANYDNPNWKIIDTYDGNGVQSMLNYDAKGNLIRKSVQDGDTVNLLHNPGFESTSRSKDAFDPFCKFKYDGLASIGDYWCTGRWNDGYQSYSMDTNDYQDGTQSQVLNINYSGQTKTYSANVFQLPDEPLSMEPNTTYVLKWKYKINTPQIYMNAQGFHDDSYPNTKEANPHDNSIGNPVTSANYTNINTWSDGYLEFTTPSYNTDGHPYWTTELYLRAVPTTTSIQNGKVWLDSVSLQKKSQAASYIEKYSQFEYYPNGLVKTEKSPEGKTTTYEWDDSGNMKAVTDALGNRTEYTYDANGNKLSQTEPEGTVTTTDPTDYKTTYNYNSRGQLTDVTSLKTNAKTSYTYDPNGNLQTSTTPNGLKTTYVYDEINRAKETINPYGFTSKVEYDANGNPKGIIDPNSKKSSSTYDAADRPVTETNPQNQTITTSYDQNDNTKTVTLENKTITLNYDKDDRVTSVTDQNIAGSNQTFTYQYDKNDNLTTSSNPVAAANNTYSLTDEITKITTNGQTTSYHRNKNNQLTQLDKSNGDTIKFTYYDNTSLKELIHSRGSTNLHYYYFEYDKNGNKNLIKINTDPARSANGEKIYRYLYDNQNQLTKSTSPDGKITQYNYDKGGNLREMINPDRTRTVYTYEGNRLIKKNNPDNSVEYYGYDANGNLTSRDNGEGINYLAHFNNSLANSRDNQTSQINDNSTTVPTYVTGKFGQSLSLNNSSYLSVSSSSNLDKKTGTIEFWFSPNWDSTDSQNRTLFENYADAKNYLRIKKTSDNKIQFQYLKDGKDYGHTSSALDLAKDNWYHLAITWNSKTTSTYLNGQTIGSRNLCSPAADFCSTYLNPITIPAPKLIFGASLIDSKTSDFADVKLDEIRISNKVLTSQELQNYQTTPAEYSLTKITTYEYDSDDYLTKITKPNNVIINYTYDSQKRLTKRTVTGNNAATTNYEYEGDQLTTEKDANNNIIAKYIYDSDGALLHIEIGTNKYYPIYDGLGSLISLRDQNGNTVANYSYDDWGKINSSDNNIAQSLRFGAYFWDKDAELYHLGARWYDPTLARFVSVDPHPGDSDDSLSQNEYLYCKNNPINFTDPDGDYVETALDIASVTYSANEFRKNRSWKNAGWLAFDSLMLVLPIAPGSGVIRMCLKTGKGAKTMEAAERARILGKAGEEAVGISSKGKKAIQINGRTRFPDKNTAKKVVEVKNVKKQGLTRQIKDLIQYSKQTNKKFELITRKSTKISKPLQKQIKMKNVKLRKILRDQ